MYNILVYTVSLACLLQSICADKDGELPITVSVPFVPLQFNAAERWPQCEEIIYQVLDESSCFSSWALAATGAMSDRICIHSNGTTKVTLSGEDLLSCCTICGIGEFEQIGCQGGSSMKAWLYWNTEGIVTGGEYKSTNGCKSYTLEACKQEYHSSNDLPLCGNIEETPTCKKMCDESYGTPYEEDLTFGNVPYLVPNNEIEIQREIAKNGPVEATFFAYEDFFEYKGGVYSHVHGQPHNYHSLKIIGWDEEDGIPYWLCVSSLTKYWGENGLIKFRRGINMNGIEADIVAGIPKN